MPIVLLRIKYRLFCNRAESSVAIGSSESRSETFQTGTPPFQPAIDFFQQCLRGEAPPAYMADHADGTLKVVEAAFESARSGRRVEL